MRSLVRPAVAGSIFLLTFAVVVWAGLDIAKRAGFDILPDLGSRRPGGAFVLTDQNGRAFTEQDLKGQTSLIYFGYTFCPDICPTHLSGMMHALAELGTTGAAIRPVFISINPDRDHVEHMRSYVAHFSDRLVGLTGTSEQVADAARAYGVSYRKMAVEDSADYQMYHSALTFLMDANGTYLATLSPDLTPEAMARQIQDALAARPER